MGTSWRFRLHFEVDVPLLSAQQAQFWFIFSIAVQRAAESRSLAVQRTALGAIWSSFYVLELPEAERPRYQAHLTAELFQ